ncbi:DUF692 domain-containing protein [Longispora albida]|uniref:DUF692 domain-containing protein n=1 Tax=Longispora albida TaxID=203523 RepID=UPI00047797C5|nr:DUF692 domain-containing protein [Longispora albida]
MTERLALGGLGLGWRPPIAGFVAGLPGLGFTEVIAESLPAVLDGPLADLRDRGVPIVPHGVRLSLGGAEEVGARRVEHLARCAEWLRAPLVSEHIAFVRGGGMEAGHLLPVPRSREALAVLVRNVRRTQAALPVPLALEPIAALFGWPEDELTEAEFLTELLERTGVYLLLDVANVYANAVNAGQDPLGALTSLPLDRIAYVHVAGGAEHDGIYHDTHAAPVPSAVLELLDAVRGAPVLLERDGHYPPADELRAELDAVADAAGLARITGDTR